MITRSIDYTARGQSERFLVPQIVSHFVRRRPFRRAGGVTGISGARGFAVCGETLNVRSGSPRTLADIIDNAQEISGRDLEIRVSPAFVG
jgi:GDP-6-deoxy-D-talose 4-dehydrogenase